MSKNRAASSLTFKNNKGLKFPAKVTYALSGTGTCTQNGVITVVCASGSVMSGAGQVYIVIGGTGTLIGTA
jgi:hypothetical protein